MQGPRNRGRVLNLGVEMNEGRVRTMRGRGGNIVYKHFCTLHWVMSIVQSIRGLARFFFCCCLICYKRLIVYPAHILELSAVGEILPQDTSRSILSVFLLTVELFF